MYLTVEKKEIFPSFQRKGVYPTISLSYRGRNYIVTTMPNSCIQPLSIPLSGAWKVTGCGWPGSCVSHNVFEVSLCKIGFNYLHKF